MGEKERHLEQFIKINNDFMADVDIYSSKEQFYYFIIKGLANNLNKSSPINIDALAKILGVSTHSKNRNAIKDVLNSMEQKKLLLLYEDIQLTNLISVPEMKVSGVYYAKLLKAGTGEKGFTKIYYSELMKFINVKDKSKDLLFSIYFNIIHRIYESESSVDYSYVTIERIEKETGINRKTIMSKIAVMMENEILYYEKVSEGSDKDKNYYCRWEDREILINSLQMERDGV